MSGTLFVVATPIGNLEDITLRALRILREVNAIAAEDTRRTARLLARHGISTPMLSFHEHNTRSRVPQVLVRLKQGDNIALVSDAGIPGFSDPGLELVQASLRAGIPVDPIPGASAPLTAAMASGFPMDPLTMYGFPPHRSQDRTMWLTKIAENPHTFTFFEAPHRIHKTLMQAAPLFGERPIVVGRELTKVHQEFIRGTLSEVIQQLTEVRGEHTVVVGPAAPSLDGRIGLPDDQRLAEYFWRLTNVAGLTRRLALKQLAETYGVSTKDVYSALVRAKRSVD